MRYLTRPQLVSLISRAYLSCDRHLCNNALLNKQIAHELGLAENTVKVHVTAILKKLECYSRTQAAVLVKSLENDHEV